MSSANKATVWIRLAFWAGLVLLPSIGCQSKPSVQLQAVGVPWFGASLGTVPTNELGFLTVYSATRTERIDARTYHPHTAYLVRKANGSAWGWIDNSLEPRDETPALVALPAGSYRLEARDQQYGSVKVPVLIEPWRTTVVYLDARTKPSLDSMNPTNSVCLPDGRIVGWQASRPQSLPGQ